MAADMTSINGWRYYLTTKIFANTGFRHAITPCLQPFLETRTLLSQDTLYGMLSLYVRLLLSFGLLAYSLSVLPPKSALPAFVHFTLKVDRHTSLLSPDTYSFT